MTPDVRTPRQIRGCGVGITTAVTSIIAHSLGHGALPGPDALAIVVAVSAAVGWWVSTRSSTTGILPMTALLIAGQMIGHLTLTVLAGAEHAAMPSTLMLTMHALATVVAAVTTRAFESSFAVVLNAIVDILRRYEPAAIGTVRTWTSLPADDRDERSDRWTLRSMPRRGPPTRTASHPHLL